MQFEVQFAPPVRQPDPILCFLPNAVKKLGEAPTHLDEGQLASCIGVLTDSSSSTEFLQHGRSGAAATVTVAKQEKSLSYYQRLVCRHFAPPRISLQVTSRFL